MRTLIAVPCMSTIPTRFFTSALAMRRVGETEFTVTESSLIYDARNTMAAEAVKEGFDRVLWLDSDMSFDADLMEKLSARVDEGRDFVSGLYVRRRPPHTPVIFRSVGATQGEDGKVRAWADPVTVIPEDIFEIGAAGFGCVMTTVQLLRDVREQFGLPFSPALGLGEDLSFCVRAAQLGVKMWCDPAIKAGHIGTKIYTQEDG